jgi:hypothetical protein
MAITDKEIRVDARPDGSSSRDSTDEGDGEQRMTKAKWLAILALGLGYTTSFQQGACLGSIVKSIDSALGMFSSNESRI